jgi:hypothetical protein
MKSFLLSHKNKRAGVSLLLAMIGSTMAISIVVAILVIVTRSVEQSQELERSTQVFFAIESGLEAGFFHHNARGQGTSFLALDDINFPEEQKIIHTATNIETDWTIDGRSETATLEGLIEENKPLQIRWFWDNADTVVEPISLFSVVPNFEFTLDPDTTILNFDFGSMDTETLISWMLTRKDDNGVASLVPSASDPTNLCGGISSFICENQLWEVSLRSDEGTIQNTFLPRTDTKTKTIINFLSDGTPNAKFQLVLTPTLEFRNSGTTAKIVGIPFKLVEKNNIILPRPDYSVRTSVSTGKFLKNINLENIPEQTSVQAFSYVIFD